MQYLTQYYKNLCEQLQEKINMLEARIRSPSEMRQQGGEEMMDELSGEPNPNPRINAGYSPWARRAEGREQLIRTAAAQLGDVARAGDVETARQVADVMADMTANPSAKDSRNKDAGLGGMLAAEEEEIRQGGEIIRPSLRDRLLSKEEKARREALAARASGESVNVPADIAAMRKFVQLGKGRYVPPLPTPGDFPHHSSNATY